MSRIPENGFIQIPRKVVEKLCAAKLSPSESKIVWTIIRKTYGWQRDADWISHTQFHLATHIPRRHVPRTLKGLIQRQIVTTILGDTKRPKCAIQEDILLWH